MHIERLRLENFRGFAALDLPLHPRLNVLIGPNGVGKSTVLKALRLFLLDQHYAPLRLSDFIDETELRSYIKRGGGRLLVDTDICHSTSRAKWDFEAEVDECRQRPFELKGWEPRCSLLRSLAANRFLSSAAARPRGKTATADEFEPSSLQFESFIDWFRDTEDRENEVRLSSDGASSHRDPDLEVVRASLSTFLSHLPGAEYRRLRITRVGEHVPVAGLMVLEKDGQTLPLDQFSDGESTLLLMVGDIARSVARTRREEHQPSDEGVILIDGIELHLHPRWQRAVMPALTATFPNIQFIVTTHSPQVIGEVPRECVISLDDFAVVPTPPTYGKDTNSILETVMGASSRDEAIKAQLATLSELIEADDFDAARARIKELSALLGADDPDLAGSRAAIDFLDGDE